MPYGIAGLDFETRSSADIRRGLDVYFNDPDYAPLLASVSWTGDRYNEQIERYDLVVGDRRWILGQIAELFRSLDAAQTIVAHNASFERHVLRKLGWKGDYSKIIDSAVISRAVGAGSKLEAAGPQLIGVDKMDSGIEGIKMFSIPREDGTFLVDDWESWDSKTLDAWRVFGDYCDLDASISREIAQQWSYGIESNEVIFEQLTQLQNDRGWFVDMELVYAMQAQYHRNLAEIEDSFRRGILGGADLNFRSTAQMKKWCAERGVRCTSFDEQHVERYIARLRKAIASPPKSWNDKKKLGAEDVLSMLETKQALGGSSLTKLQTIIDMVGKDGRLRGQYLHVGAGQSYRTSGRGVQMQNLKRLGSEIDDVEEVLEGTEQWTNAKLARNLRQCFMAEDPDGELIVGDFSSVESRGLAFLAGEEWKLDAFWNGRDLYKVLAATMFGIDYNDVDKSQRQTGKVGELSCGYGAGAGAVSRFAQKMHVDIDEEEAAVIVSDWRAANPKVVQLWADIQELLMSALITKSRRSMDISEGRLRLTFDAMTESKSVTDIKPNAAMVTMELHLLHPRSKAKPARADSFMSRMFRGVHLDGKDICYMKPSELKSGKLWLDTWHKNGESGKYKLYGGKLTGILVQSFCRQLFFRAMQRAEGSLSQYSNVQLIGQFHDELVLEWAPPGSGLTFGTAADRARLPLATAMNLLEAAMTGDPDFPGFPLVADVKHGHRYIK